MAVIEIDEDTAAALRAEAHLRDMSLEVFLQRIAESAAALNAAPALSLAEMDRSLDEVSTESPVLPGFFPRAEIYADHD